MTIKLKQVIHYPDTNSVEATWIDEHGNVVLCHSYADVQLDMLRADLGADAAEYADLIAEVEANIKPPAPIPLQVRIDANVAAIQSELDSQSRAKGYDNIVSACSYAAQPAGSPFQAEGAAFLKWRSAVWQQAYATLAEVEAGTRPLPTPEESVAAMPPLVLP